jgi:putative sterol carrier protein
MKMVDKERSNPDMIGEWMVDLTKRLDSQPEQLSGVNARYQVDFTADGCGMWYIIISNGKAQVAEGEIGPYDNKITMKGSDFLSLTSGQLKPALAFMTGRIRVTGNLMKLTALQWLFESS